MLPEWSAYSRRFVRPTVRPSIRPSYFCSENISKSIKDNLMKLYTLKEDHEKMHNARTITLSTVFTESLPFFIFAIISLSESYL